MPAHSIMPVPSSMIRCFSAWRTAPDDRSRVFDRPAAEGTGALPLGARVDTGPQNSAARREIEFWHLNINACYANARRVRGVFRMRFYEILMNTVCVSCLLFVFRQCPRVLTYPRGEKVARLLARGNANYHRDRFRTEVLTKM